MLKIIKSAALCAMLGCGTMAAVPAQADMLYVGSGHRGPEVGIVIRDREHHRHWRHHDRDYHWRAHSGAVRFCTAGHALDKATRMGVRRARVNFENRSVIGVRGHDRHGRIQLTFARVPGCPLVR
jgi:hypothetical protein